MRARIRHTTRTEFFPKTAVALLLGLAFLMISCNGENVPDCFQNAGDTKRKVLDVTEFGKITVFENLNLVLKQGSAHRVEVESGEYLIEGVSAQVEEGRLVLHGDTGCNLVRKYGGTTVYVTAPNITEIRSSTGLLISSDGVLSYPSLNLIAESYNNPETETTDGSFDLDLEADLGIDSIKRVEILSAMQEKVPSLPEVETSKMATLNTLQEIVDYMQSLLGPVSAPASSAKTST